GSNRERVVLNELDQRLLEGAELEEKVFFGDGFEEASAVGAGRARGCVDEGLVGDAVGTCVGVEVNVAALEERGEELLNTSGVARLRGADVVVVGETHAVPQRAELRRDLVGELLRGNAGG